MGLRPPTSTGLGRVGGGRRRCRRAVVEDQAVLDVDDAVGVGLQARVVGDADHRRAVLLGGALQQADDDLAVLAVERGGGLVGEQQLRVLGQGAGDGDALLLAAGQLGRALVQARLQARPRSARGWPARGPRRPGTPWYFRMISTCCRAVSAGNRLKPWKMKPQWSSRNRSILPARSVQRSWPSAVTEPGVGLQQARERGDQGRLARARGAHDHGHLAVAGLEVDALQHLDAAAAGLEALDEAGGATSARLRAHRSRSAGWLFLRTPRDRRPEAMAMMHQQIATADDPGSRAGSPWARRAMAASMDTPPDQDGGGDQADDADPEGQLHARSGAATPWRRRARAGEANSLMLDRIAPRRVCEVMPTPIRKPRNDARSPGRCR